MFSHQQVAVTAKTDSGALRPLQVDVRVLGLHVPETALQRALLGKQRLQPEKRTNGLKKPIRELFRPNTVSPKNIYTLKAVFECACFWAEDLHNNYLLLSCCWLLNLLH